MAKTFTVNGQTYPVMELDFNTMCELEDRGISMDTVDAKPLKILREYLAIVAGKTSTWAGKQIEAHIVAGGDMADLYDALNEAMESSGFFQAMSKSGVPEEVGESEKTKKPAK